MVQARFQGEASIYISDGCPTLLTDSHQVLYRWRFIHPCDVFTTHTDLTHSDHRVCNSNVRLGCQSRAYGRGLT